MKYFVKFAVVCLEQDLSDEKVSATEVNEYYKLFEKLLSLSLETKILNCCFQGLQCLFSTSTTNFPTNVNMKWLNSLLTKNLCSACWDIRDSTLGFIKHLLRCQLDDNESYVRATCISAIGFLAMHDRIWKHFQEILTLTEEEVLNCILMQFKDEESAFARRATVETLCFWLERKHNIILLHLELVKSFRLTPISEVLEMASQDFDWEVKVLVLDFWKIMLQDIKWKVVPLENIESNFINEVGKYILSAIIDCDAPVRAKGFELLNVIKTRTNEIARQPTLLYKSSIDELYNFIIKAQKDCNKSLLKTLLTVNFSDYIEHYQTVTTFLQDPIPFLRDILTAASENEDNLLDCY
ncbi:BRCA1-associated ATM activator 1-like isoform X2 [Xenia sp. Carnegie-2017]|uniref:BRCA1-associated ATM activator 1-like isoform X2 n=1 Tax=Xenia sp. Carnegie-2017 TaxID=2897299 RepID=UPI001F04BCCC|nr:BRCA1-associated ATM activator 1-like isoform X2 [Xenia sp. Carnegie-2017]